MIDPLSGIHVFVKVVDEGSFSKAADALGLPKSTVSRHVSRLEDRLGVRLLHRTTRSLGLTEVGASYYERCSRIVADAAEAEDAVTQMQTEPRGTLRISGPLTFGYLFLGEVVAEFMKRYDGVDVHIDLTDRLVDLVDEGYDLAIRVGRLRDSSMIARKLGETRRVVCASPGYLAQHGTPKTAEDLDNHQCLLYSHQQTSLQWTFDDGANVQVTGRLVCNNGDVLRAAAVAGVGVAYAPRFIVARAIAEGLLVPVLEHLTQSRLGGVYVVYPQNRHLSAKVRAFVDFAAEYFSPEAPWEASCPD